MLLSLHTIVSIKRTGCNKRTGWAEFFHLLHEKRVQGRVSVQGGHFATLCREFDFYVVKKFIIFQKEKGNNFTLLIIFIVKSLQKEQNSTNLLL
jgi:hypothetical protein